MSCRTDGPGGDAAVTTPAQESTASKYCVQGRSCPGDPVLPRVFCSLTASFTTTCRKPNALTAKLALALTSGRSRDGGREPAVQDLATPVPRASPQPTPTVGARSTLQHVDCRPRIQIPLPFDNLVFVQLRPRGGCSRGQSSSSEAPVAGSRELEQDIVLNC